MVPWESERVNFSLQQLLPKGYFWEESHFFEEMKLDAEVRWRPMCIVNIFKNRKEWDSRGFHKSKKRTFKNSDMSQMAHIEINIPSPLGTI